MTENELLEALAAELYLEPRLPGDVDNEQLAQRLGIGARRELRVCRVTWITSNSRSG